MNKNERRKKKSPVLDPDPLEREWQWNCKLQNTVERSDLFLGTQFFFKTLLRAKHSRASLLSPSEARKPSPVSLTPAWGKIWDDPHRQRETNFTLGPRETNFTLGPCETNFTLCPRETISLPIAEWRIARKRKERDAACDSALTVTHWHDRRRRKRREKHSTSHSTTKKRYTPIYVIMNSQS